LPADAGASSLKGNRRWIGSFSVVRQRHPPVARLRRVSTWSNVRAAAAPQPGSLAGPRTCPSSISVATAVTWRQWLAP